MSWQQLSTVTHADLAPQVSELLSSLGALSVTLADAGDQPLYEPPPGETKIWQQTRVTGLFENDVELAPIQALISQLLGAPAVGSWQVEPLQDQVWERTWLDHFQPMRFGRRLWVMPNDQAAAETDAIVLRLDPGLAFGTGTHPTTALCLEWLDSQDLAGKIVVDYGCGSGILGIAALLLGAAQVIAVDIDPQALTATRSNAVNNGVAAKLQCCLPDQQPRQSADIVVANILATPLIELTASILAPLRPGGQLVLSGILREQADAVAAAYQQAIDFDAPQLREDWVRLQGARRQP